MFTHKHDFKNREGCGSQLKWASPCSCPQQTGFNWQLGFLVKVFTTSPFLSHQSSTATHQLTELFHLHTVSLLKYFNSTAQGQDCVPILTGLNLCGVQFVFLSMANECIGLLFVTQRDIQGRTMGVKMHS